MPQPLPNFDAQRQFIESFLTTGRADLAAKAAGVSAARPYMWAEKYPDFQSRWDEARKQIRENPPETLVRRTGGYPRLRQTNARKRKANQDKFLVAFKLLGLVGPALKHCDLYPSTHMNWCKNDLEYRARFQKLKRQLKKNPPKTLLAIDYSPRAEKTRKRHKQNRRPKQRVFLRTFAQLGQIGLAAKKAGISPATHADWLTIDAEYRSQFEEIKKNIREKPPATLVPRVYNRKPKDPVVVPEIWKTKRRRSEGRILVSRIGHIVITWSDSTSGKKVRHRDAIGNISNISYPEACALLDQHIDEIRRKQLERGALVQQLLWQHENPNAIPPAVDPGRIQVVRKPTRNWIFTQDQHTRLHRIARALENRDMIGFVSDLDADADFRKLCQPDYSTCSAAYKAKAAPYYTKLRVLKSRALSNRWL